jgi:hypothetical protein
VVLLDFPPARADQSCRNRKEEDVSSMNRAAPDLSGPNTNAPGLEGDIDRAVAFARPYIDGLLARSAPTATILRALAEELTQARAGTRSVAHPELLDPDAYWQKAAWPQAAAFVKNARRALVELAEELEAPIRAGEGVLEHWLAQQVQADAAARAADPAGVRARTIDAIAGRCEAVHRLVERLLAIRPDRAPIVAARAAVDESRRQQAIDDVRHSRDAVAKAHPELDRAAFKQMWIDTVDARVAQCDSMLRAELPHRHQELLVSAFEQALDAIDEDITRMVAELTEPILGIGQRLVRRYDELVAETFLGDGLLEPR